MSAAARESGDAGAVTIPVELERGRYLIRLARGGLADIADYVQHTTQARACAVIADSNVAALHGDDVVGTLRAGGMSAALFSFAAGERSKTRAVWAELTDALLRAGYGRDACVVALGGGVTGDLAGFVAATYLRGVPLVQVPTTLLAMIDAAVGGKTGVDTPAGKNLVGAFHQPAGVLVDPDVLRSLPSSVLVDGFAEAVKHAAIADAAQIDWIAQHAAALRTGDAAALDSLLCSSIPIKAAIVSADPLERDVRVVLNFGHTIAHALEQLTDFRLPHGRAVAIGLVAEAAIGEALGITAPATAAQLAATLDLLGLPHRLPEHAPERIVAATATDKKARDGVVRYVLLERLGTCARNSDGRWTHAVEPAAAAAALAAFAVR